jgi:hypothetical protein
MESAGSPETSVSVMKLNDVREQRTKTKQTNSVAFSPEKKDNILDNDNANFNNDIGTVV